MPAISCAIPPGGAANVTAAPLFLDDAPLLIHRLIETTTLANPIHLTFPSQDRRLRSNGRQSVCGHSLITKETTIPNAWGSLALLAAHVVMPTLMNLFVVGSFLRALGSI
jgi:hypothetical protein